MPSRLANNCNGLLPVLTSYSSSSSLFYCVAMRLDCNCVFLAGLLAIYSSVGLISSRLVSSCYAFSRSNPVASSSL